MDRTSRCNKVEVRLDASYRMNLLLLRFQKALNKNLRGVQIYVNNLFLFLEQFWLAEVNREIFEYSS